MKSVSLLNIFAVLALSGGCKTSSPTAQTGSPASPPSTPDNVFTLNFSHSQSGQCTGTDLYFKDPTHPLRDIRISIKNSVIKNIEFRPGSSQFIYRIFKSPELPTEFQPSECKLENFKTTPQLSGRVICKNLYYSLAPLFTQLPLPEGVTEPEPIEGPVSLDATFSCEPAKKEDKGA